MMMVMIKLLVSDDDDDDDEASDDDGTTSYAPLQALCRQMNCPTLKKRLVTFLLQLFRF